MTDNAIWCLEMDGYPGYEEVIAQAVENAQQDLGGA
jgi:hypothetical protein